MPIANILNSQNRKYVNRMSSIILVCAIALARARPFTRKRKNNPAVVGGVLRHLRRWFFLPVEPSTCIYIKWRVVGIFKSNSLSNKHELVQKGRDGGGGSAVRERWVSIYHQRDNELVPFPRSSAPRGTRNPRRSSPLSFSLSVSQSIPSLLPLALYSSFTSRLSKPWPNAGNEKMIRKYTLGSWVD